MSKTKIEKPKTRRFAISRRAGRRSRLRWELRRGKHGAASRLAGRRLKPLESKEVKPLLERALPPMLPPEKEGGPV